MHWCSAKRLSISWKSKASSSHWPQSVMSEWLSWFAANLHNEAHFIIMCSATCDHLFTILQPIFLLPCHHPSCRLQRLCYVQTNFALVSMCAHGTVKGWKQPTLNSSTGSSYFTGMPPSWQTFHRRGKGDNSQKCFQCSAGWLRGKGEPSTGHQRCSSSVNITHLIPEQSSTLAEESSSPTMCPW